MLSRRLLRIKVLKALYAHLKSESTNMITSEKTLMSSIDKAYDLYAQMLTLIVELARYAEQRQELARQKKLPTHEDLNPNRRFVDNAVVRLIENSDSVNDFTAKRKLSWSQAPELVKTLYATLSERDYFKAYMTAPETSFRDDLKLVQRFYTEELENCEMLEEVLEEQSIMWNDDLGFALLLVLRTLSNVRKSTKEIRLLPEFKNEDDPAFARTLFEKSLIGYNENLKTVESFTRNWDSDRIAFMDNLIMATAIAELVTFPSIPVKVTLDEYIEISKYYSTAGSGMFINGVLDKVVEQFSADGRIRKSGTGLI
ncbi:MAG: transcription termination factor [Alistipes sp.]|nr:transcription termination factor [Alistipes sp.]